MVQEVVNIVCMKWGTRYTEQDVNILHSMVKRNLTLPHRFVCLTDDPSNITKEIECFPMPEIQVPSEYDMSPWRKLGMFSKKIADLSGKCLFLDLDIVITDNIDCFFTFSDKFTIIKNWSQRDHGIGNSSVYCFNIGQYSDVLEYYNDNMQEVLSTHEDEQTYLSKKIQNINYWPDDWCKSFKRHCRPPYIIRYFKEPILPANAKIIIFHGVPKPKDAIKGGFYGNFLRYIRPTKWVENYWR